MGGFGSGRVEDPETRRRRAEDCLSIDIRVLIRKGALEPGSRFLIWGNFEGDDAEPSRFLLVPQRSQVDSRPVGEDGGALIVERLRPRAGDYDLVGAQTIPITTAGLHHGGRRHYLMCPGLEGSGHPCDRRALKLYLPVGERQFACTACHGLTHRSRQIRDPVRRCRLPSRRMGRRWRRRVLVYWPPDCRIEYRPLGTWPVDLGLGHDRMEPELAAAHEKLVRRGLHPGEVAFDGFMVLLAHFLRDRLNVSRISSPPFPPYPVETLLEDDRVRTKAFKAWGRAACAMASQARQAAREERRQSLLENGYKDGGTDVDAAGADRSVSPTPAPGDHANVEETTHNP